MKTKNYRSKLPPKALIRKILVAKSVLISGHQRPDGDSLGCMIALAHVLNQLGIQAYAAVELKRGLGSPAFLRGVKDLLRPEAAAQNTYDLLIAVDCATMDRLPEDLLPVIRKIPHSVSIDHHKTNTHFAEVNWVQEASSAGELVWRLIHYAKWPLDEVTAEALWVAVITDTGRFAYDMTSADTLRCGADLVAHGVRTAFINDKIYCSFSRKAVELKRRAYQTLEIQDDVAWVTISGKDFEEIGGTKTDTEDVIEIPRSIVGNQVALFFYGSKENECETRISIRTRDPLDASKLAALFGGGGHRQAAGCTIYEPMEEAKKTFLETLARWREETT